MRESTATVRLNTLRLPDEEGVVSDGHGRLVGVMIEEGGTRRTKRKGEGDASVN